MLVIFAFFAKTRKRSIRMAADLSFGICESFASLSTFLLFMLNNDNVKSTISSICPKSMAARNAMTGVFARECVTEGERALNHRRPLGAVFRGASRAVADSEFCWDRAGGSPNDTPLTAIEQKPIAASLKLRQMSDKVVIIAYEGVWSGTLLRFDCHSLTELGLLQR